MSHWTGTEHLDSGTGDEKPLVNAAVDSGRWQIGGTWDGLDLGGISTVVLERRVAAASVSR